MMAGLRIWWSHSVNFLPSSFHCGSPSHFIWWVLRSDPELCIFLWSSGRRAWKGNSFRGAHFSVPGAKGHCRVQEQERLLATLGMSTWFLWEPPEIWEIMRSNPKLGEEREYISHYWLTQENGLNPSDHSIQESTRKHLLNQGNMTEEIMKSQDHISDTFKDQLGTIQKKEWLHLKHVDYNS